MDKTKTLNQKEIKQFILDFFNYLNVDIKEENGSLKIKNAPKEFEDFVGKSAPYTLIFDARESKKYENSELIVEGSYFIYAIRDYMRDKGQFGLKSLKIEAKDPEKDIKERLKLNNCSIKEIKKEKGEGFFYIFNFLVDLEFLSNKKQDIIPIAISNKRKIEFDPAKYFLKDYNGKLDTDFSDEIEDSYNIAKKSIVEHLGTDLYLIKKQNKEKLQKEIKRLREHFSEQKNEKDDELEQKKEKLKLFESRLENAYYPNEISLLKIKIDDCEKAIEALEKEGYKKRLDKEEEFCINDEIDKHAVRIDNRLINVLIVSYPTYLFKVILSQYKKEKEIELSFNPVLNELELPACNSCNQELSEINFCSNGHLYCNDCRSRCKVCKKDFCKKCLEFSCDECHSKICNLCKVKCENCNKIFCNEHITTCEICNKKTCSSCSEKCGLCKKIVCKKHLKKCSNCNNQLCEKCAEKELYRCNECRKGICGSCAEKCKKCGKQFCSDHVGSCSKCKDKFCKKHLEECSICGKKFCAKCLFECEGCKEKICENDTIVCKKCGSKVCKKCLRTKKAIFGLIDQKRCVKCIDGKNQK